jgi:hypothetical protein
MALMQLARRGQSLIDRAENDAEHNAESAVEPTDRIHHGTGNVILVRPRLVLAIRRLTRRQLKPCRQD